MRARWLVAPGRGVGSGRRRLARLGLGASIVAVAFGCGARAMVDGGADDDDDEDEVVAGSSGSGASGEGGGGPSGGGAQAAPIAPGSVRIPGVALPDCEPGFSRSSAGARQCTYIFRRDCYEQPLLACACACEGLPDNNCIIGGFLNPDEPQRVSCVAR